MEVNKEDCDVVTTVTEKIVSTALGYTPMDAALKGANLGVSELDDTGKVVSSQLPSFVDDVVEGYLYNGEFYEDEEHTTKMAGESGKIYIDLSTEKTYRWSGSIYTVISETLALGETSSTAYRGDRGKIAYDHSQTAHAPSNAEKNQNAFANVKVGDTTIIADNTSDTLTLTAGDNITITPNATTDSITISAADTTYEDVTDTESGLMSPEYKSKLDGIAAGANSVSFSRSLTSGTKVGTITINGTGTDLYAPNDFYTKSEIDNKIGDIETILASVVGGN